MPELSVYSWLGLSVGLNIVLLVLLLTAPRGVSSRR